MISDRLLFIPSDMRIRVGIDDYLLHPTLRVRMGIGPVEAQNFESVVWLEAQDARTLAEHLLEAAESIEKESQKR